MRPHSIPAIAVIGMIGLLAATAPLARAQTTSIRDYTVEKKDEAVAYAKKATADLDAKIKDLKAKRAKASEGEGRGAEPRHGRVLGQGQGGLRERLPRPGGGL